MPIHYRDPRTAGRARFHPVTLCGRLVEDLPAPKVVLPPLDTPAITPREGVCRKCTTVRNTDAFIEWYDENVPDDDYTLIRA